MTIVAKSTIDRKTGDLYMQVLPQEFDSRQKAHDAMREEYFKELKKLGLEATGANMNDLKLQKARDEKVAQQQLDAAKEQAALLEEKSVTLSIKAGEGGKAFGSVSSKEIAAAYKEQCNMEIDKKKIQLPESIKTFGMHEVPVKLHPQVTGKLHVKVVEA